MAYIVTDKYGPTKLTQLKPYRYGDKWITSLGRWGNTVILTKDVASILTDGHIPTFDDEPVEIGIIPAYDNSVD